MATTPVMYTVTTSCEAAGVAIEPGTYAGMEIIRADMNSAGGRRVTYSLDLVTPEQDGDSILVTPKKLDVSELVSAGKIEVD